MHPTICSIGPFTIYSYGFMLAAAAVICAFLMARDARKEGIASDTILDLLFWVVFCGIIGARIFFVVLNLEYFSQHPSEIIMVQNGGLAWQGSLLAGALAGIRYVRRKRLPLWTMLDLAAPYIALGEAIGRIGCFLNGCCQGKPVRWGPYFPVHDAHLHPAQLYSTATLLIIFFILKKFRTSSRRQGETFALYLILAAIQRFGVEFFRGDHETLVLGLSVFQWVTVGIFLTGCLVMRSRRRHPPISS